MSNKLNDMITKLIDEVVADDDAETIAERLSEISVTTMRAMTLCTVLAHKKIARLRACDEHVLTYMTGYLINYAKRYGNPLRDVDEMYRRIVLETRDEIERFLGVAPQPEDDDE